MSRPLKFERLTPKERRTAIIDVAIEVLQESGGKDFSIRKISQRAGISDGLINHHFGTRDELVARVYEAMSLRQLCAFEKRLAEQPLEGLAKVDLFIDCYFSDEALDPQALPVWIKFWELFERSGRMREAHEMTFGSYCRLLEGCLADCGLAPAAVRPAALGLIAMLDGLWLEYILNPKSFSRSEGLKIAKHWIRLHMIAADHEEKPSE